MKRIVLYAVLCVAVSAFCGDLDVARQSLADGVWRSALAAADSAAVTTNAADRTEARLISLEALAHLEDDAEIRRRLSGWNDETSERFRFWRIRSLIRVGDFDQAKESMAKPFPIFLLLFRRRRSMLRFLWHLGNIKRRCRSCPRWM